jgi:hypothetical protein
MISAQTRLQACQAQGNTGVRPAIQVRGRLCPVHAFTPAHTPAMAPPYFYGFKFSYTDKDERR